MRALVDDNASDLLAYFRRRVTPEEDAADLLGETLLILWRRLGDLPSEDERARMWMFGVARKLLANHRRSSDRRQALTERLKRELLLAPAPIDGRAADAIEMLPPHQRELILLVHGDGFSIAEAAKLMGTNASTARTRYGSALAALRRSLVETNV